LTKRAKGHKINLPASIAFGKRELELEIEQPLMGGEAGWNRGSCVVPAAQ
jgi:hypothetical protein